MRVLWFVNCPLEPLQRELGLPTTGSGFWMYSLLSKLQESTEFDFAVVTVLPGIPSSRRKIDGVEYFCIGTPKYAHLRIFESRTQRKVLLDCDEIIQSWRPDLLHVHGTERFFGLVHKYPNGRKVPMVVSLQGILYACAQHAFGKAGVRNLLVRTTLWELLRGATPLSIGARWKRHSKREAKILESADAVVGRTAWDRSFTRKIANDKTYFHVDEMIRPAFVNAKSWDADVCVKGTLFVTSNASPLKCLDVLLKAVAVVRGGGMWVRLRIAGLSVGSCRKTSYGRYLLDLIKDLDLASNIELLGWLDSGSIVRELQSSNCFVLPSLIENSPNSLCEAQLVGVPCVASNVGGIDSIISHGESGCLFSAGDEFKLAAAIERVLADTDFAIRIAKSGQTDARGRHDAVQILGSMRECYYATCQQESVGV